jgi:hypothetical protein
VNPVILYAVHSLLALVLAAGMLCPRGWRRPILVVTAVLGCAGGLALALDVGSESVWRSTTLEQPSGAIAGSAVACAWLLAGVLGNRRTLGSAALMGLASSGLLLASLNDWIVPALLFWLASSVAVMLLLASDGIRVGALFAVALSDLALVGALSLHALDDSTWTLPSSLDGLGLWLALGALVVRTGAIPAIGVWESLGTRSAPALPLLVGGSLALLGPLVAGAEQWAAVGALVGGLTCCLVALTAPELRIAVVGAWPVWLSLGLLLAAPDTLRVASVAALLAVTATALWPPTEALGRGPRGFLLGTLAGTPGFLALVAGATLAFERATEASTPGVSATWSALAALLLLVVAAGVALGARIARQTGPGEADPLAGWSMRALFLVALALGLAPPSLWGLPEHLLGERSPWLIGAGLALALGAALAAHRGSPSAAPTTEPMEAHPGVIVYASEGEDVAVMVGVAALIGLGSLAAVVYLAVEGLSYGFLPPGNF